MSNLYDDVYGLSYSNAETKLRILNSEISEYAGQGFSSLEELEEWAHEHLLDKIVYMNMSHKFFYISHKGELMTKESYMDYYKSVLFTSERHGSKVLDCPWVPEGFKYLDKAYIAKKLGVTTEEFEEIIARPNKTMNNYKNTLWLIKMGIFISRMFGIENRNLR